MQKMLTNLRRRRAKEDRGFTLIELLVVVVILGILIAIAIPLYLNYRKGANDAAAASDLRGAINTLEQCNVDNGHYPRKDFEFGSADSGFSQAPYDCDRAQNINLSTGTQFAYRAESNPVEGDSYVIIDRNANGSGKVYCYNSARGGQVGGARQNYGDVKEADVKAC